MADDLSAQGSSLRARQTKGSTDMPEESTPKFRLDRHHKTIGAGLMERETFVGCGTVILLTVKIRCPGGTAAEAQAFLPSPTDTGR